MQMCLKGCRNSWVIQINTCWQSPRYLVEVRSCFCFHCSEFSYRLLLDGHPEVVAVLYSRDEQLNPHFDLHWEESSLNERTRYKLEKPEQATLFSGWSELQLTVLHFSISVLISGLTFSIRSTRFALLFIIPPGMTKTLVPPTDKTDSGWLRLESFRMHRECFKATLIT